MNQAQEEIARAVEAGYWQTYRFNPTAAKKFTLDSKPPKASYQDFIKGENRYASLLRQFPDVAPELFAEAQKDAEDRLASYERLAAQE
jgi:pyruvate-ferredoxin/flavodoxin oxidoreductase